MARRPLGRDPRGAASGPDDDFFDLGGGSLTAAQLVSRLRERFPEVTVADVYDHPGLGDLAAALDVMAAPTGRHERRTVRPVPRRDPGRARCSRPSASRTIGGLRWLTWVGAGHHWSAAASSASPGCRRRAGAGWSSAGCCWSPRPAGCCSPPPARPRRARRGRPRRLPARRQACTCGSGSPSGSPTSWAPPTSPARRWCGSTRGCSAPRSAGTSTCTACRRSPACSPSATAARSSPRSTSPATGSTATCCTSARRGRRRRPGRRAQHALPGADVGDRRRDRARLRGLRRGARRRGLVGGARPGRAARPADRGPTTGPPQPAGLARGVRRVGRRPVAAADRSPCVAGARRGAPPRWPGRRHRRTPCARAGSGCRSRPWSASSCSPLLVLVAVRLLALGPGARPPPGARAARLAGVGDAARPRRGPHLALPALLQLAHPGLAAGARRRRRARTSRPRPCC